MRQSWRSVIQDWELEIEWLRGGYLVRVLRNGAPCEQNRYRDIWEAIERGAYVAVIWPLHLN